MKRPRDAVGIYRMVELRNVSSQQIAAGRSGICPEYNKIGMVIFGAKRPARLVDRRLTARKGRAAGHSNKLADIRGDRIGESEKR
jgi:hypothetical protein